MKTLQIIKLGMVIFIFISQTAMATRERIVLVPDTLIKDSAQSAIRDTLKPKKEKKEFFLFAFLKKQLHHLQPESAKKSAPPSLTPDSLSKSKNSSGLNDSLQKSNQNPGGNNGKNGSDDPQKKQGSGSSTRSSGSISAGYDYGVIPLAANAVYPMGYYKTEGNFGLDLLTLPFNFNFFYADLNNVTGLNNYFRIAFDSRKYHERLNEQLQSKEKEEQGQLNDLYKERQEAQKQLNYLKSMKSFNGSNMFQNSLRKGDGFSSALADSLKKDSLTRSLSMPQTDSLNIKEISSSYEKKYMDSLKKDTANAAQADTSNSAKKYTENIDSLNAKIKKYESLIKTCNDNINREITRLNVLKNANKSGSSDPYGNSGGSLLSSLKKFEVGLCYPDYSTFLINGTALKGINVEMENKDNFLAFSAGKTTNNLLFTNNAVQNTLQNARNLYNFFDFNNVDQNRSVIAVKAGFGKKDSSHLHIGLLYGIGKTSYFPDSLQSQVVPAQNEKNYVGELDGKLILNSSHKFDLVYGKSSTQQNSEQLTDAEKGFNAMLSRDHTNAVLLRYTLNIHKSRTRLVLTGRRIDTFFNSYGLGYMRPDNYRYEIRLDQELSGKLKFNIFYRKESDNLLSLYSMTTSLQTFGTNITWKLNRRLTIKAGYTPVLQKINSSDNTIHLTNMNNISNFLVSYSPKLAGMSTSFNALYNYYNVATDTSTLKFQNLNFSNVSQFKNGIRNTVSVSLFYSGNPDTTIGNSVIYTDEIGYSFNNNTSFTAGIKLADDRQYKNQIGYSAKLHTKLYRKFSCELFAEKIVIGDFYNNYNLAQIQKFPYFCSSKIIYNW